MDMPCVGARPLTRIPYCPPFGRHAVHQTNSASLASGVGAEANGIGVDSGGRGGDDDIAAVLASSSGDRRLAGEEHTAVDGVRHVIPLFLCGVLDTGPAGQGTSGVGEHNVEASVFLHSGCHGLLDLGLDPDVGLQADASPPADLDLLGYEVSSVFDQVGDDDFAPFGTPLHGALTSKPCSATRDYDALTSKPT